MFSGAELDVELRGRALRSVGEEEFGEVILRDGSEGRGLHCW